MVLSLSHQAKNGILGQEQSNIRETDKHLIFHQSQMRFDFAYFSFFKKTLNQRQLQVFGFLEMTAFNHENLYLTAYNN